jgi:hypothetical protein
MTSQMIEKDARSEEQARAQLESIREMLAKLDRDSAIDLFASDLSREDCVALLASISIDSNDDEPVEDLREAVAENMKDHTLDEDDVEGFEFDEDEARQAIEEDPLSVEVRSPWFTVGSPDADTRPAEFCILLCTGGPAVRIMGELDDNLEPDRAWLEHQDWGTPWTQYYEPGIQETLLAYARCFYFGE